MMAILDARKASVAAEVRRLEVRLQDVARDIHARPELAFEEHFAADLLASALEEAGLAVQRGPYGLETSFAGYAGGEAGTGPTVAILCEYDALPGIGHACGHNLIAAAGLGAGLAAAAVVGETGGRLLVLGTPAEESGGGKVRLLEAGAFDEVDVAMMVHPASFDLTEAKVIAGAVWRVEYRGIGAHAAACPERGRNALDAAVLGYNAVAALRQHIAQDEQIHGVFLNAGELANIIPKFAVAEWIVRAPTLQRLQPLKERVRACLEAGARAAGCNVTITATSPEYSHLRTNPALMQLYRDNSATAGRPVSDPGPPHQVTVSTDMGNVSLQVPSIHPLVAVAPPDVALHTAEFARHAAGREATRAVLDAATAMAMTAVDVWLRPGVIEEIRQAHRKADVNGT